MRTMMKLQNRVAIVVPMAVALLCSASALADTWTQNTTMDRYQDDASYDMSYWSDGSGNPGQTTYGLD